jgi:hypothetical protein
VGGPVQATFTWNPSNGSDLPPNCAILRESASASFSGLAQAPNLPPGGASHGLGDSNSGNSTGVSGIRYTIIQNPGQTSYADSVDPNAWVDAQFGKEWVNATYSAQLYAIWIDTTNTVNDGGYIYAEAGEQTQAKMTCWMPGATFSNYQWTATGSIFRSYDPYSTPARSLNSRS